MAVQAKNGNTKWNRSQAKVKPTPISLCAFLSNQGDNKSSSPLNFSQMSKSVRKIQEHSASRQPLDIATYYDLPTEPRAYRTLEFDENIPREPPFLAFISNLPFNADEAEVRALFRDRKIVSLDCPKRTRGIAYVKLETRTELIALLKLGQSLCRGRCVRIDVATRRNTCHVPARSGKDNTWKKEALQVQCQPPKRAAFNMHSKKEFPSLKPLDVRRTYKESEMQQRLDKSLQKLSNLENGKRLSNASFSKAKTKGKDKLKEKDKEKCSDSQGQRRPKNSSP